MSRSRAVLLLLFLPLSIAACHDDGLAGPGPGDGPNGGALPTCDALGDQASCSARSDCAVLGCPACDGSITFVGCGKAGAPSHLLCAPPSCASPCTAHTDESTCAADTTCFAIYTDPGTCDCAGDGCCMQFDHCASGPPQCSPSAAGPQCNGLPWSCGPDYDPVFDGACQVGCVKVPTCTDDCRVHGCPDGATCQPCWSTYECMIGGDAC